MSEPEEKEEIQCCAHCHEPTVQIRSGDEGWTYCQSCQIVEGKTIMLTEDQVAS